MTLVVSLGMFVLGLLIIMALPFVLKTLFNLPYPLKRLPTTVASHTTMGQSPGVKENWRELTVQFFEVERHWIHTDFEGKGYALHPYECEMIACQMCESALRCGDDPHAACKAVAEVLDEWLDRKKRKQELKEFCPHI